MITANGRRERAAVPGDWLAVAGLPGRPARRGQVVEVLGRPGHERYRVRWDEQHESVFYPSEGWRIVPARGRCSPPAQRPMPAC